MNSVWQTQTGNLVWQIFCISVIIVLLCFREDKTIMQKNKHLTFDERLSIQNMLNERRSFAAIGKSLEKHRTTISKEIRSHIIFKRIGAYGKAFNDCAFRNSCSALRLCSSCNKSHNFYCRFCDKCRSVCDNYTPVSCEKLSKPPYVCNGCKDVRNCRLQKSFYDAAAAQKEYLDTLSEARTGINSDEANISRLDNIISPLLHKGQSLHHICSTHSDELMISERSLYRYVDMALFKARNIDLPRKVRYRPRKSKLSFKVDKACRVGRTYVDFENFIDSNPDIPIVEMDTVEGVKGGKVLLTIHFIQSEFMLAFLRDSNTSKSVTDIFNQLYTELGDELFKKLFPLILTDNGSEFSNPTAIECTAEGEIRSRIFYCNASSPFQKGAIENNHEFIRRIIPKGKSFDNLTQNDINVMISHINSYKRKKLNDKTPIESFSFFYGSSTATMLHVERIDSDKVTISPSLLK